MITTQPYPGRAKPTAKKFPVLRFKSFPTVDPHVNLPVKYFIQASLILGLACGRFQWIWDRLWIQFLHPIDKRCFAGRAQAPFLPCT